jgi:hypothetical protein
MKYIITATLAATAAIGIVASRYMINKNKNKIEK